MIPIVFTLDRAGHCSHSPTWIAYLYKLPRMLCMGSDDPHEYSVSAQPSPSDSGNYSGEDSHASFNSN